MGLRTEVLQSIFEGHQQSSQFGSPGQFMDSIGIDPDMPVTDDNDDIKPGGVIRPVNYVQFTGEEITSSPIAIIPNPKDSYIYVVLSEGKILRYSSELVWDETFGGTGYVIVTEDSMNPAAARGADYYNNFIYVRTPEDVSRLGPLDGSPTVTDNYWTSDLSQTALTDTEYPVTLFNIGYLNHFGKVHVDNKLYFLDYKDGRGLVHFIKTQAGGGTEGNDDDGSTYGALDLPLNYYPITIESYGNDMSIAASFTKDANVLQGVAKLFFWDTVNNSFYRSVPLPHALASVLKYDNGTLYVICGDLAGGYEVRRYVGGDATEPQCTVNEGYPPLQSAADYVGNRLVWAADRSIPMNCSGLFAWATKSDEFPRALHHIALSGFRFDAGDE